jgi:hypothetical protein
VPDQTLHWRIANLFKAAGLPEDRAQTLRRTFASTAAELGFGTAVIGELLGRPYV